ncbi:MAG: DsbA family protein [Clostridiales Family XIII bacterium]|jgi:predicted DsbA family dithiol-disulfide isomerase|nr:DsbA family protein [Clostridiales Family XIII bacterium]
MKLHIYFDYTCPFSYISESQIKAVKPSFPEIELVWHPFELRPRPIVRPEVSVDLDTGKAWDPALLAEAAKEGLPLHTPFSPLPYSDRAFQGMHCVNAGGGDVQAYNERIFKAVFAEGKDISDLDVLAEIANDIGIDAYAFNHQLREGIFKDAQQKALRHAYFESGVEETPTFKLAGMRISGAVGREILEKFLGDGLKEEKKSQKAEADAGQRKEKSRP